MFVSEKRNFSNSRLKRNLNIRLKEILETKCENPVLKAVSHWKILSDQLHHLLGKEVHDQWFKSASPLVLIDDTLIIQTKSTFAAQWINTHYHELADSLLKAQDRKLSSFFVAPRDQNAPLR